MAPQNSTRRRRASLSRAEPPVQALRSHHPFRQTSQRPPPVQLSAPTQIDIEGTFDGLVAFAQVFLNEEGQNRLVAQFDAQNPPPIGTFNVSVPTGSYQVQDVLPEGALNIFDQEYTIRAVASTGEGGTGISSEASSAVEIIDLGEPSILLNYASDGNAEADLLSDTSVVGAVSLADADGPFADFGEDGTMTEMRTRIDGTDLFVAVRGAFFGANDDNEDNALFLFFDANLGSGIGVQDPATELNDTADGLRTQISDAMLELDTGLQSSVGFDGAIAMTSPNIVAGYTFGTADLPTSGGSTTDFLFQPGIMAAFDGDTGSIPGAGGTAIAGDDTVEFKIPLEVLGIDADNQREIGIIAFVSNDSGTFPSPNTLPENPTDTGGVSQVFLEVVPVSVPFASVVLNEVSLGATDQIELFNAGAFPISLAGHILVMRDGSGERREYAFPPGATIAANGFVVLSDEGGATGTPPPDTTTEFFTGFNIPWDSSRGGAAILLDRQGNALDYVDWLNTDGDIQSGVQRDLPYPAKFTGTAPSAPAANQSLGRSVDSLDTDGAGDWENTGGIDAVSPTFGTVNGILIPLDGMLSR